LTVVHSLDSAAAAAAVASAPVPIPAVPPPPAVVSPEQRQQEYERVRTCLRDTVRDLEVQGEPLVLEGSPASEIAALAESRHAAVVVVGSVGRTGLARMLLGSVAEEVSRRAPCSVLVVR
jgi:nucleotide-binding universal stress UspA family protein